MFQLTRKKWPLKFMILIAILIFPLITAFRLLQGDFESLEAVLIWIIAGGGSMWLVGYVEAYLLENWAGWHGLPRWTKTLFPILMAAIFGVIAQSLLAFDVIASLPPAIGMLLLAAANWIFSQKAYISAKKEGYANAARTAAEDGISVA
jgi:hypothetical protein